MSESERAARPAVDRSKEAAEAVGAGRPTAGVPAQVPMAASAASAASAQEQLPIGYRQGVITAISVLLGFSLSFWRYYGLEVPGAWNPFAVIVAVSLVVAVVLQIVAMFRALRVEDDCVEAYRVTVRWLVASTIFLLCALSGAIADDIF